jgi:N6-adenosine-specific RNA methylase IME4
MLKCPSCRRKFVPKRSDAKTCSDRCRQRAHRTRLSVTESLRLELSGEALNTAIEAVNRGADIRAARRAAKKADYYKRIEAANPKGLEGTFRVLYADPPWKYIGLNQADEYGHAERHYDCLTDEQLCDYRPGNGTRTVKELADKDAVLFLWVTSPLLKRCFPIIEAWGFEYKASFIWDKNAHVMGHYNSVQHELLLICTRGQCTTPDLPKKLIRSVVQEERSKHSEKPERFYEIIESMYRYGRKLELFSRNPRKGWDADGNESVELLEAA